MEPITLENTLYRQSSAYAQSVTVRHEPVDDAVALTHGDITIILTRTDLEQLQNFLDANSLTLDTSSAAYHSH